MHSILTTLKSPIRRSQSSICRKNTHFFKNAEFFPRFFKNLRNFFRDFYLSRAIIQISTKNYRNSIIICSFAAS